LKQEGDRRGLETYLRSVVCRLSSAMKPALVEITPEVLLKAAA
jgi:hypothetical protein